MKRFLLLLLLSGCRHYAVATDLGPDHDHFNNFRCLGFCQGQNLYDIKISDNRYCFCAPDRLSD